MELPFSQMAAKTANINKWSEDGHEEYDDTEERRSRNPPPAASA
jgi:hypothetical protein